MLIGVLALKELHKTWLNNTQGKTYFKLNCAITEMSYKIPRSTFSRQSLKVHHKLYYVQKI